MEFHKVSRFYDIFPLQLYNEGIATQSQESFALRFYNILEKSTIQPYLVVVIQDSSSRFHHVFEYVGLLTVLIH